MSDPDPEPVDAGTKNQWHPIFDSVVDWLESEARRPDPGTPPIVRNGRRRPVLPVASRKRVKA